MYTLLSLFTFITVVFYSLLNLHILFIIAKIQQVMPQLLHLVAVMLMDSAHCL